MRRIVLLRAVNVGGAKLPMAELRDVAIALGARNVSTHIASGNLIVDVDHAQRFDRTLEQAIEARFGFFREAISRSPEELASALAAHPFEITGEVKFHHIYFLVAPPTPAQTQALLDRGLPERLDVIGRDLHVQYPGGLADTKLTPALIARTLGSAATGRNLKTVRALVALTSEPQDS